MDQKELPIDYKFITRMGLDKRLFDSFTELRKLLKEHGYTDDTVVHISSAPSELWEQYLDFQNRLNDIISTLKDYGMIEQFHFTGLSFETKEYITSEMKKIEESIPLAKKE